MTEPKDAEFVVVGNRGRRVADCGDVIRRLHDMSAGVELDDFDDRAALKLLGKVLGALETSDQSVFAT